MTYIVDDENKLCNGGCGKTMKNETNPVCKDIGICEDCCKTRNDDEFKIYIIKSYLDKHPNAGKLEVSTKLRDFGITIKLINKFLKEESILEKIKKEEEKNANNEVIDERKKKRENFIKELRNLETVDQHYTYNKVDYINELKNKQEKQKIEKENSQFVKDQIARKEELKQKKREEYKKILEQESVR